jgi:hypothetical protein
MSDNVTGFYGFTIIFQNRIVNAEAGFSPQVAGKLTKCIPRKWSWHRSGDPRLFGVKG